MTTTASTIPAVMFTTADGDSHSPVPTLGLAPLNPVIKSGAMFSVVEVITAQQAAHILEYAEQGGGGLKQRRPSPNLIREWQAAIKAGEWRAVPPGLIWSTPGDDGKAALLNGQHRLRAQVSTGLTLPWLVTYNCPLDAFPLIDTGKKRTTGDALFMAGAADTGNVGAQLGSALRLMVCYLRYAAQVGQEGPLAEGESAFPEWTLWNRVRVSNPSILTALREHSGMQESIRVGYRIRNSKTGLGGFNTAAIAWFHRLVSDMDPGYGTEGGPLDVFLRQIVTGEHIGKDDPALALRNWFLAGMPCGGEMSHRTQRERALFGLIAAWNAFARRQPMDRLRFTRADRMPLPKSVRPPKNDGGSGRS